MANELLLSGVFKDVKRWKFKSAAHINLLESSVIRSWLSDLVGVSLGATRPVGLVDSRIAALSGAKGRSSSVLLQSSLEKMCCIQLVGRLYPGFQFAPTRLNIADAPTRHADVPEPCRPPSSWLRDLNLVEFVLCLPGLRRAAANWAGLTLALLFPPVWPGSWPARC